MSDTLQLQCMTSTGLSSLSVTSKMRKSFSLNLSQSRNEIIYDEILHSSLHELDLSHCKDNVLRAGKCCFLQSLTGGSCQAALC